MAEQKPSGDEKERSAEQTEERTERERTPGDQIGAAETQSGDVTARGGPRTREEEIRAGARPPRDDVPRSVGGGTEGGSAGGVAVP